MKSIPNIDHVDYENNDVIGELELRVNIDDPSFIQGNPIGTIVGWGIDGNCRGYYKVKIDKKYFSDSAYGKIEEWYDDSNPMNPSMGHYFKKELTLIQ